MTGERELCERIAREAHRGQKRRGSEEDCINHPLRVAAIVNDSVLSCIALLHDVLEDTKETESSLIKKGVSRPIVDGVKILTNSEYQPYDEYISAITRYPRIVRVKIADMFDNLTCEPTKKQKEKYRRVIKRLYMHL